MRKKILMTDPELHMLEGAMPDISKVWEIRTAHSTGEKHLMQMAADVNLIAMCYAPITAKVIEAATDLWGIAKYGVGVDSIDLAAATRSGVIVANCPIYGTETIAEHAFALMICLSRKIMAMDRSMRISGWKEPIPELLGTELNGKTLGIIGCGRIGRAMSSRASAFRMQCIAYDPYVTDSDLLREGITPVPLAELLETSDIVSIHAVLTPETRGILSQRELRRMKPHALIINVARGAIIDEPSLIKALKEGWIGGAGLDVFTSEPLQSTHPLFGFDNVILTPHLAWYTKEAHERLEKDMLQNIMDILNGKVPPYVKNPDAVPLFLKKRKPSL